MRRAPIAVIFVLASFALIVAGCGGDDETTTTPTTTEATGTADETGQADDSITVSMTEYAFEPSDITVKEGSGVLEVVNDGELPHNLTIEGQDAATSDLEAGASQQLLLSNGASLPPGEYEFICTIGDHAAQGMVGTLTVE